MLPPVGVRISFIILSIAFQHIGVNGVYTLYSRYILVQSIRSCTVDMSLYILYRRFVDRNFELCAFDMYASHLS